jgi:ankyrin repeat protein
MGGIGWTPMHCAAAEGHLEVFEFLVKGNEVDLQAATYDGEFFEDVVEDEDLRQKVTGNVFMLLLLFFR